MCVGLIVMCVLLFLTKLFALLPYTIMGAVIIGGVSTLIEVRYAYTLFRTDLRDFLIFLVTFCVVIFYSIDIGLGVGIGLSLFVYILETGFPSKQRLGRFVVGVGKARPSGSGSGSGSGGAGEAVVVDTKSGRLPGDDPASSSDDAFADQNPLSSSATTKAAAGAAAVAAAATPATAVDTFVDAAQFPGLAQPLPAGVVALRLQAPIAFNNTQALEDTVDDIVVDAERAHRSDPSASPLVQYVILDMLASGHIDSGGCQSIGTEIAERMANRGVQVALAGANPRVLRALERTGALSKGNLRAWVFTNVADAVAATQHTRLVLTEAARAADAKAADEAAAREARAAKRAARRAGGGVGALCAGGARPAAGV